MNYKKNKWYFFNKLKGSRQARPPVGKYVLVQIECTCETSSYDPICVGYFRNAAGDKQSPMFVSVGMYGEFSEVYAWNDCLPDNFFYNIDKSKRMTLDEKIAIKKMELGAQNYEILKNAGQINIK
jgi:hypothetical protein